jgi:hypothetical protein
MICEVHQGVTVGWTIIQTLCSRPGVALDILELKPTRIWPDPLTKLLQHTPQRKKVRQMTRHSRSSWRKSLHVHDVTALTLSFVITIIIISTNRGTSARIVSGTGLPVGLFGMYLLVLDEGRTSIMGLMDPFSLQVRGKWLKLYARSQCKLTRVMADKSRQARKLHLWRSHSQGTLDRWRTGLALHCFQAQEAAQTVASLLT